MARTCLICWSISITGFCDHLQTCMLCGSGPARSYLEAPSAESTLCTAEVLKYTACWFMRLRRDLAGVDGMHVRWPCTSLHCQPTQLQTTKSTTKAYNTAGLISLFVLSGAEVEIWWLRQRWVLCCNKRCGGRCPGLLQCNKSPENP